MDNDKSTELLLRLGENGSKILDTFTKAGIAYLGFKSANHWTGALTALIALRLATGGNLAGGIAGAGILAGIGIHEGTKMIEWPYDPSTGEISGWLPPGWELMLPKS